MAASKKKLWSTTSTGTFDHIVIGAGMGGMVCAATLAKMGKRVLLLEQHYVPGGYLQTFRRNDWTWDVGLHMVPETSRDYDLGRLLAYLTDNRVAWQSLGDPYDLYEWPGEFTFTYHATPEGYRDALCTAFPEERIAIDQWMKMTSDTFARSQAYIKTKLLPPRLMRLARWMAGRGIESTGISRTTEQALDSITQNPQLRAVLTGQWFYWGTPPSESSFLVDSAATMNFRNGGGTYPIGGASALIDGILQTVVDAGGAVRVCADVEKILLDGRRAIGVQIRGRHNEPAEVIHAKKITSAAGVYSTIRHLLPESIANESWASSVTRLRPNNAYISLFLGFEGDIRSVGASPMNRGYYDTWNVEAKWEINGLDDIKRVPFFWVCFNSLKDPLHDPGPNQRYSGEVMCFVPWELFAPWQGSQWRRRPEEYEALKAALQQVLLKQFLERMPALEPMIVHAELSTPLSADHFVRAPNGSAYGLHHTPDRFLNPWLHPKSPITNLYFSGNELIVLGVGGASVGGLLAAVAAEPLSSLGVLRAIS